MVDGGFVRLPASSLDFMRVSLSWLQDLVQVNEPADQLAERLSMAGFEVEEIDDLSRLAQGVVVGHVLERDSNLTPTSSAFARSSGCRGTPDRRGRQQCARRDSCAGGHGWCCLASSRHDDQGRSAARGGQ